jgi:choice-of-anchor B domain-containing protein
MRKTSILLAGVACMLVMAGSASAHPVPGGMSFGLYSGWFTLEDQKLRDLASAANQPMAAQGSAAAECVNGMAGEFPCENVNLLGNLSLAEIGGGEIGNDVWGWTDPANGREYAIMGKTNGAAFVDVTDGANPRYLGMMPTQAEGSRMFWRDIKVYKNHAFVVSEHIGHDMQVFDLTRLRTVSTEPQTFSADNVYTIGGAGNTHNLDINETTGFAYLVGTSTCRGGLHMVDIRDPQSPRFAGCFAQDGYTHDTQCEIYRGPDRAYGGREICFASNEDTVTIVDVTDKSKPKMISRTGYRTSAYTHQGWLTADWEHFVFNDELDELDGKAPEGRQTTYVINVESLRRPGKVMASPNNTTSTDHNLYIKDGYVYESNYTSGLRIFDEDSVPSADLDEVAWFDIYPEDDAPGFDGGTWSNYPHYRDGKVVVSSIDRGIFVLEPELDR